MRLRIESLAKGGDSVARHDGRVIFLDGGAPGDVVEAELVETKPRFARGVVRALVEPGPDRVDAPCRWAETCGGCPWQSVSMTAQHTAKQQMVERALGKLGAVEPLRPAPRDLGYRQRATLHQRGGKVGFFARRSHEVVAIDRCLALEPALDEALMRVRAALPSLGEEGALRATIASGQVLVAIEPGRGAAATLAERAAELVKEGMVAGATVGKQLFGQELVDAGGEFWVSASGFRQANDAQNDVLRALVREALRVDGASLLELYCGDGNFTRDALGAQRVVAVEEDAAAIARLRRNVPSVTAVCARVEREVERRAGEKWDRVLLDPPRAGAKDAMSAIGALAPGRIVYVSCDVATLARDLATTNEAYRLERAVPVDMMPQTDHVEVVATLTRR